MTATEKPSASDNGELDFDHVLSELGFGKYQLFNYILICIPIALSAIYTLGYVFTAGHVDYRCRIPECEPAYSSVSSSLAAWEFTNFTIPPDTTCSRYAPINVNDLDADTCSVDRFNQSAIIPCSEFIFDPAESTIVNEWNITCDQQWKLAMVGTLNNIGQFVTLPITGWISDRYGRKAVLVWGTVITGIIGLVKSFSQSYGTFMGMEFLDPAIGSGVYSAGFILGMELVRPENRVIGGTAICCAYAIGEAALGIVAMWCKNWRLLLQVCYTPAILIFVYQWIIPESGRWLLTQGKRDRAKAIVMKMAKQNGVTLSPKTVASLNEAPQLKHISANEMATSNNPPLRIVLKSSVLLIRLALCSFSWLTNTFVYFGLSLNSVTVAGNKYINFILVSVIEVPAYFVTLLVVDRYGRRRTLAVSLMASGIACMISEFPDADNFVMRLSLYLFGKFAITIAFTVLYVYTTELFPTSLRHSLLGICSTFGRIGSMLAPQTPLLAQIGVALPMLCFGTVAIISGLSVLQLPETMNTELPDSIQDAEQIGKRRTKNAVV